MNRRLAPFFQNDLGPTASKEKIDEFKELLNLALKGSPIESEQASEKLLAEFRVKVVRPVSVRSFSIH